MRDDCSVDEFALVMGVTPTTVRGWIKRGKMPSAFKNEMDQWRIPIDTDRPTKMYHNKRVAAFPRLINRKDDEILSLRTELANEKERLLKILEQHAALRGKYDKLLLQFEIAEEDAKAFERMYHDMKSQYDQLALTVNGLAIHEEGSCQVQKMVSNTTPAFRKRRKRTR